MIADCNAHLRRYVTAEGEELEEHGAEAGEAFDQISLLAAKISLQPAATQSEAFLKLRVAIKHLKLIAMHDQEGNFLDEETQTVYLLMCDVAEYLSGD